MCPCSVCIIAHFRNLLFFFYCYVDHRDLHSFPTRRSSDLPGDFASPRGGLQESDVEPGVVRDENRGAGELEEHRQQDRKSTRLNSSHSQISYAVFCLKKKIALKASRYQDSTRFAAMKIPEA